MILFSAVLAAVVTATDGGVECVELPAGDTMRMRMCGAYTTAYSDLPESTDRATALHDFLAGLLSGFGGAPRDFELTRVTLKSKKAVPALRTALSNADVTYDATAISGVAPGTTRARVAACLANTGQGATKAGCITRLESLMSEAAIQLPAAPTIDGRAMQAPTGCHFDGMSLLCDESQLLLLPFSNKAETRAAATAESRRATEAFGKQLGKTVTVAQAPCTREGQNPLCHIATATDGAGQVRYATTMVFFREEGVTFAVCTSVENPREHMPKACASVLKFGAEP